MSFCVTMLTPLKVPLRCGCLRIGDIMDYIVGLLNLNMLHVVPPCPHMWDIFHEDIDRQSTRHYICMCVMPWVCMSNA